MPKLFCAFADSGKLGNFCYKMDPKILTCLTLKLHELLQRTLEFPKNVASFECNPCHLVTPNNVPEWDPLGRSTSSHSFPRVVFLRSRDADHPGARDPASAARGGDPGGF